MKIRELIANAKSEKIGAAITAVNAFIADFEGKFDLTEETPDGTVMTAITRLKGWVSEISTGKIPVATGKPSIIDDIYYLAGLTGEPVLPENPDWKFANKSGIHGRPVVIGLGARSGITINDISRISFEGYEFIGNLPKASYEQGVAYLASCKEVMDDAKKEQEALKELGQTARVALNQIPTDWSVIVDNVKNGTTISKEGHPLLVNGVRGNSILGNRMTYEADCSFKGELTVEGYKKPYKVELNKLRRAVYFVVKSTEDDVEIEQA